MTKHSGNLAGQLIKHDIQGVSGLVHIFLSTSNGRKTSVSRVYLER